MDINFITVSKDKSPIAVLNGPEKTGRDISNDTVFMVGIM